MESKALIKTETIVVSKELRPELTKRIDEVTEKLKAVPAIVDQATADDANKRLKEAKNLISLIEAERKEITRPLDEVKKMVMDMEKTATSSLTALIQVLNKKLTDFAAEQERKKKEEEERIRKEAEEKAKAETARISAIRDKITKFHTDALKTILNIVTVEQADEKYKNLSNLKFSAEVYQEFLPEVEALREPLLLKIKEKREALEKADQEALQKQADQEAAEMAKAQEEGEKAKEAAIVSALDNVQMEEELKTSTLSGAKSIQKRWKLKGVSDLSKVPSEFLTVDEKKVAEAIKAGRYEIPGLIIEQEITNVSR